MTVDMDAILKEMGAGWERPPGSVTAREWSEQHNQDVRKVRWKMDRAVREGLMTAVLGPNPRFGGPCKFYSVVKGEK